jgi:hypothetical protein
MPDDVERLRSALERFEDQARSLPWAADRRWGVGTHVWIEHGAPTIDLHDLNVKLANEVVETVLEVAPSCASGGFVFVTGRGLHSPGGRSDLQESVGSTLDRASRERGWAWHPSRAGRLVLVTDPRRAPSIATGELPIAVIVGTAVFLGLALWFATPVGIVLTVAALAIAWMVRQQSAGYDEEP